MKGPHMYILESGRSVCASSRCSISPGRWGTFNPLFGLEEREGGTPLLFLSPRERSFRRLAIHSFPSFLLRVHHPFGWTFFLISRPGQTRYTQLCTFLSLFLPRSECVCVFSEKQTPQLSGPKEGEVCFLLFPFSSSHLLQD